MEWMYFSFLHHGTRLVLRRLLIFFLLIFSSPILLGWFFGVRAQELQADFAFASVTFDPATRIPTVVVTNQGQAHARVGGPGISPPGLRLKWHSDTGAEIAGSGYHFSLFVNNDQIFEVNETKAFVGDAPPPGAATLRLTLDPPPASNQVRESNEENNAWEGPVIFSDTTGENLAVYDEDVVAAEIATDLTEEDSEITQTPTPISSESPTPTHEPTEEPTPTPELTPYEIPSPVSPVGLLDDSPTQTPTPEASPESSPESTPWPATSPAAPPMRIKPRILPGNPLYFFKDAGREIRSLFAFDADDKVTLRRRFANEKILEANALADREQSKTLVRHLQRYEKDLDKLERLTNAIKKDNPAAAEHLSEKLLRDQFRHQVLLGKFERKASTETLGDIKQARSNTAAHIGKTLDRIDSASAEQVISQAMRSDGSPFRSLRNLEVLKAVEEKVTEQAKDAIRLAVERSARHFAIQLGALPNQHQKLLAEYTEHAGGDEVYYVKAFDAIKREGVKEGAEEEFVAARGKVFVRLEKRVRDASTANPERAKEVFVSLADGSVEDLRALSDIEQSRSAMLAEPVAAVKKEALERFSAKVQELDTAEKRQWFTRDVAKKYSDLTQLRLADELKEQLPETKKVIADELRKTLVSGIKERLAAAKDEERKTALRAVGSENLEDIKIVETISAELGKTTSAEVRDAIKQQYETAAAAFPPTVSPSPSPKTTPTPLTPTTAPPKLAPTPLLTPITSPTIKIFPTPTPTPFIKLSPIPTPTPVIKLSPTSISFCPTDYKPVCGYDGKTYTNDCFAKQAGIAVLYYGECKLTLTPTPAPSPTPSPTPSPPTSCPTDYKPVCGTDNKTYTNDCFARQAGVGVQYYGECKITPSLTPSTSSGPTPSATATPSPTPKPSPTPTPTPTPTPSPTKPDYTIESPVSFPSPPFSGNKMTFSATVKNLGGAGTGSSYTRLHIDVGNDGKWDVSTQDLFTDALAQSATKTETWKDVWAATQGTHKYEICADAFNFLTESSETNNCISVIFVVK